jgi:2-haloacid dehalogenase
VSPQRVRALTFDVFGTVVDWRTGIARELRDCFAPRGLERDWHAVADRWRALYQPAMAAVRDGRRAWTRLDDLHRENLQSVLDEVGLAALSEAEIEHLNRAWHRLDPWPDAVAGLTRLRRRYILATLSNGNITLLVNMARRAGLPWDAILGAEVARAYKPMPEAYLPNAECLGLAPAECMLVAAHNDDLLAARACGFRTAFVARPTEHGPCQSKDLRAEHDFDIVATDFIELARQLGC